MYTARPPIPPLAQKQLPVPAVPASHCQTTVNAPVPRSPLPTGSTPVNQETLLVVVAGMKAGRVTACAAARTARSLQPRPRCIPAVKLSTGSSSSSSSDEFEALYGRAKEIGEWTVGLRRQVRGWVGGWCVQVGSSVYVQ